MFSFQFGANLAQFMDYYTNTIDLGCAGFAQIFIIAKGTSFQALLLHNF